MVHRLDQQGFHPTPAIGPETPYPAADIDAVVEIRLIDFVSKGVADGGLLRSTGFGLFMDDVPPGRASASFHWDMFEGEHVIVCLTGSIRASEEEQAEYQEPFASRILAIARDL